MYEFIFGILAGALCTRLATRTTMVDKSIQVCPIPDPPRTSPISIRNSFVPGNLKNFWGPDS